MTSNGQRMGHSLVTLTYKGVKWLALKFSYYYNSYNNIWIEGYPYCR